MPFFVALILYFQTWGVYFILTAVTVCKHPYFFFSLLNICRHCALYVACCCFLSVKSGVRLALMMVPGFYFPSPSLFLLHCSTNHLHSPTPVLVLHSYHTSWQIYIYDLTICNKIAIQGNKNRLMESSAIVCHPPFGDTCKFVYIVMLLAFTQSVDNLFH